MTTELISTAVHSEITVVSAVIYDAQGQCLLQQRGPTREFGGMWEHPGGKVESDETHEAALARELREELGVALTSMRGPVLSVYFAPPVVRRAVTLAAYFCGVTGTPQCLEDQTGLLWSDPKWSSPGLRYTAASRLVIAYLRVTGSQ
jgi:8-oxo-dGTP diphosphatase